MFLPEIFSQLSQPLFLIKIVFLILLLFYAIFSLVIFNQAIVMGRIVKQVHSSAVLDLIAFLNMFLAISLFLISLVIL